MSDAVFSGTRYEADGSDNPEEHNEQKGQALLACVTKDERNRRRREYLLRGR